MSDQYVQALVPNCFSPESYYKLDVRRGVLNNRFDTKCCTFSAHALRGLYLGLVHETGPAAKLVLRRCGETWGRRMASRFMDEIKSFYGEGPESMSMARFIALAQEYFAVSGWGRLHFDLDLAAEGIFVAELENPIMGDIFFENREKMDVLMEGILKELFSHASGELLDCYETAGVAEGHPVSTFVIALATRLKKAPDWVEAGKQHAEIVANLRTAAVA